jgi:hypothetical protein
MPRAATVVAAPTRSQSASSVRRRRPALHTRLKSYCPAVARDQDRKVVAVQAIGPAPGVEFGRIEHNPADASDPDSQATNRLISDSSMRCPNSSPPSAATAHHASTVASCITIQKGQDQVRIGPERIKSIAHQRYPKLAMGKAG